MAFSPLKWTAAGLTAAMLLAGCSHATPVSPTVTSGELAARAEAERPLEAPVRSLGREVIADDDKLGLTPEKAEGKARARAAAWQADAELRFVGWGVVKSKLLSAVTHVFYSPSTGEVLVVKTFLRDKWSDADVYDQAVVTKPASVLQALGDVAIDGARALRLSRKYFIGDRFPISLVTLTHPPKLPFAFWGVVANATVVLVHAETGQSLSPRGFDPFPKEWTK